MLQPKEKSYLREYGSLFTDKKRMSTPKEHLRVEHAGCGINEKSNSCDDLKCSGIAWYSTAESVYSGYIPHGWTGYNGRFNEVEEAVEYDAIPAYEDLQFTRCGIKDNGPDACQAASCNTTLFTGVGTDHDPSYSTYGMGDRYELILDAEIPGYGEGWYTGGKCPDSSAMNSGKTPAPQRRCSTCLAWGACMKGSGGIECDGNKSYMCARNFDKSNTCQTIGKTFGNSAVSSVYDAGGQGYGDVGYNSQIKTKDPHFKNGDNLYYGNAVCRYPVNSLETAAHVRKFRNAYDSDQPVIPNNRYFINPLMESVCRRLVDNRKLEGKCKPSATGEQPEVCSNFFSTIDNMGEECMRWLNSNRNVQTGIPKTVDNIIRDHCDKFPWLKECECTKKDSNPVYRYMMDKSQIAQSYPVVCWFKPCHQDHMNNALIEDEVLDKAGNCPDKICQNIQDVRQTYASQFEFDQYIDCSVSYGDGGDGDGDGSGDTNTGAPIATPFSPSAQGRVASASDSSDVLGKGSGGIVTTVIYLVAALVLLIVAGVGYYLYQSSQQDKKPQQQKKEKKKKKIST